MIKSIRILVLIFLFILLTGSIWLYSCKFEDMGLNLGLEGKEENEIEAPKISPVIDSAELFLELKGKQKDKNPLSDINVRKAIFYAVNRERIAGEILEGYGNVLNSLFTEDSIYHIPAWEQYSYDLNKAKEFLEKAGYDSQNNLYITIGTSDSSPSRRIIADLIKEDLEEIGIKVWIFNKPPEEWYIGSLLKGNYELGIWSLYTNNLKDLENYFHSNKIPTMETKDNINCRNLYWYSNKDADSIIESLSDEYDPEKRKDKVEDLQKILSEDAIILPLYNRILTVAFNKDVKNIDIDASTGNFLKNAENWEIDDYKSDVEEEIVVGYEEEPYVLNPFITDSDYTGYINSLIIMGLWETDENDNYIPVLAEETVPYDQRQIRYSLKVKVKLKDDIFWEDGKPVTSEDVKYTWKAVAEDEKLLEIFEEYKIIEDIELINEKEFNISFKEYYKDWERLFRFIFPKSKVEDRNMGYLFRNEIVGSGPYKLKEWVRGEYILLEENEYYFDKKPNVKYIKFLFNSDINYLITMLKDGEVDIVNIPADLELMEKIEDYKDIDVLVKQGSLWEHLAICLKPKE